MHYKDYSTEDFIKDGFFQLWVEKPNEESNRYWTSFLEQYPQQKSRIEEAREFLLSLRSGLSTMQSSIDQIKADFNKKIDQYETVDPVVTTLTDDPSPSLKNGRKFFYRIAASLAVIALVAYLLIRFDAWQNLYATYAYEEQRTPNGKQTRLILPDGTRIWLNSNSRLTYPKNFNTRATREVQLSGEAFFEVAANEQKPFIVHTSTAAIKVLGTAFNVRSYASDSLIETTLVHGKISILTEEEADAPGVTLAPRERAFINKSTKKIKLVKEVTTENYTSWKSGWIVFEDKPFSYIKETLERWYDVTIIVEDKNSLSCPFSGKFKDKTLPEVLEIFKATESINYRIEQDKVFIQGRLCDYY